MISVQRVKCIGWGITVAALLNSLVLGGSRDKRQVHAWFKTCQATELWKLFMLDFHASRLTFISMDTVSGWRSQKK
jgi:hypothetical protein